MTLRSRETSGQSRDHNVRRQHPDSRDQEQTSTTDILGIQRASICQEQVPHGEAAVDAGDLAVVCDANQFEDGS